MKKIKTYYEFLEMRIQESKEVENIRVPVEMYYGVPVDENRNPLPADHPEWQKYKC